LREVETNYEPSTREWPKPAWNDFKSPKELATEILTHNPTSVDENAVEIIADKVSEVRDGFLIHKNLKRPLASQKKPLGGRRNIDWFTAKPLAIGTLCMEGYHMRISLQDVESGTFSQRRAVLHDQNSETTRTPLNNLTDGLARSTISNSPLSEVGSWASGTATLYRFLKRW